MNARTITPERLAELLAPPQRRPDEGEAAWQSRLDIEGEELLALLGLDEGE